MHRKKDEERATGVCTGNPLLSFGVSDGTRTRDSQDHNLVLYQLNYTHHTGQLLDAMRRSLQRSVVYMPPVGGTKSGVADAAALGIGGVRRHSSVIFFAAAATSSEVGPGCGTKAVAR